MVHLIVLLVRFSIANSGLGAFGQPVFRLGVFPCRLGLVVPSVPFASASLVTQNETGQGARGTSQDRADCRATARDRTEQGSAAGADGTAAQGTLLLARHADTSKGKNRQQDNGQAFQRFQVYPHVEPPYNVALSCQLLIVPVSKRLIGNTRLQLGPYQLRPDDPHHRKIEVLGIILVVGIDVTDDRVHRHPPQAFGKFCRESLPFQFGMPLDHVLLDGHDMPDAPDKADLGIRLQGLPLLPGLNRHLFEFLAQIDRRFFLGSKRDTGAGKNGQE